MFGARQWLKSSIPQGEDFYVIDFFSFNTNRLMVGRKTESSNVPKLWTQLKNWTRKRASRDGDLTLHFRHIFSLIKIVVLYNQLCSSGSHLAFPKGRTIFFCLTIYNNIPHLLSLYWLTIKRYSKNPYFVSTNYLRELLNFSFPFVCL